MRFGLACLLLVALAGCHLLFQLDEIEPPLREAGADDDALGGDGISACGTHDEDNDGAFDSCDTCPIDVNPGDGDDDSDNIGDVCDPHRGSLTDKIVFFSSFTNLDGWITAGGATQEGDSVALQGGSMNRAYGLFDTLAIPLTFSGSVNNADAFFIYLEGPDYECRIYPGPCATTGTGQACISVASGQLAERPIQYPITAITRVVIARNITTVDCRTYGPTLTGIGLPAAIASGVLYVQANNEMRATLHSAILYGR